MEYIWIPDAYVKFHWQTLCF